MPRITFKNGKLVKEYINEHEEIDIHEHTEELVREVNDAEVDLDNIKETLKDLTKICPTSTKLKEIRHKIKHIIKSMDEVVLLVKKFDVEEDSEVYGKTYEELLEDAKKNHP